MGSKVFGVNLTQFGPNSDIPDVFYLGIKTTYKDLISILNTEVCHRYYDDLHENKSFTLFYIQSVVPFSKYWKPLSLNIKGNFARKIISSKNS